MRTILDIIVACKDREPATEEELRLTVVALSAMLHLAEDELRKLVEAVLAGNASARLRAGVAQKADEARFKSRKMSPRDYLGDTYTPGTPENERLKQTAKAIFKAATGQDL